jgi:hypothetical protein
MDKDALVSESEPTKSGERLIEALAADGFDVRVAFWAKPTDEGKWFLYLASPIVDSEGPAVAYRRVQRVLRTTPGLWIDPFDIRVVGLNDSIAEGAAAAIASKLPNGPFAVPNPKPSAGMTLFNGTTLGGVSIDGVYIYPSLKTGASV